jgi:hypothetical protein
MFDKLRFKKTVKKEMVEFAAVDASAFFYYNLSQRKTKEGLFLDLNDPQIVFNLLTSGGERILDKGKATCVYCHSLFRVGDGIGKINHNDPKISACAPKVPCITMTVL